VLSACIARGGAIFRVLGIAALLLLLPFGTLGAAEDISVAQLRPSLVLLGVFVAGAVFALFKVSRGVQDRIARTSLVAR
jgi:hypothetical protein